MSQPCKLKYYSKSKMPEEGVDLADFSVYDDDVKQFLGYVEGLHRGYREAQISQFLIYRFANEDFRLFEMR